MTRNCPLDADAVLYCNSVSRIKLGIFDLDLDLECNFITFSLVA